jgi:hypothetical protein
MGFEESKKHLVPLLQVFSQDVEPGIRQALVEQLPEIARFFFSQNNKKEKEEQEDKSAEDIEEGYGIACYTIIPMLAELTTERHPQVRASAVDSLIQLASIIRVTFHLLDSTVEKQLSPFVAFVLPCCTFYQCVFMKLQS